MPTPTELVEVHPVFPWLTAPRRAWLYRVAAALAAVLVTLGYLTETDALVWLGLVSALIGTGTAAGHTPGTS